MYWTACEFKLRLYVMQDLKGDFLRRDLQPNLVSQEVFVQVRGRQFIRATDTDSLCRSRAIQISMNVSILEEWVGKMGLPRGVQSHFAPVRDLLNWLQVRNPYRDPIGLLLHLIVSLVSLYYQ
jgi:hypothetical protein